MYFMLYFCFFCINFFCPSPFNLFVLTSFIKNSIWEVGICFMFRNPYIALSIKVSRRRRKEIFVWKSVKILTYLNWTLLDLPFYTAWFKTPSPPSLPTFFESRRIFLPFLLDSLIEHEILVNFAFVQYLWAFLKK